MYVCVCVCVCVTWTHFMTRDKFFYFKLWLLFLFQSYDYVLHMKQLVTDWAQQEHKFILC